MRSQKSKPVIFFLAAVMLMSLCACGNDVKKADKFSEVIPGEWYGQVDVASMVYKELGDEMGIDLSPEPVYCDVLLVFNEDNSYILKIDTDEFTVAVGKCAEPYVSAILGFDTEMIVDIIMKYVAKDMPVDVGEETGTYAVDDEELTVLLTNDDGEKTNMVLDYDGYLEYADDEIGQVVLFEKQ